MAKFVTKANIATWWPKLAFYFDGEITQVIDSIPWVCCASGNVYTNIFEIRNLACAPKSQKSELDQIVHRLIYFPFVVSTMFQLSVVSQI